jgi:hypothetical protein
MVNYFKLNVFGFTHLRKAFIAFPNRSPGSLNWPVFLFAGSKVGQKGGMRQL